MQRFLLFGIVLSVAVAGAAPATAQTFDNDEADFLAALDSSTTQGFDGLAHEEIVTDQLPGMTFVPVPFCPPDNGGIALDTDVHPFYGLAFSPSNVLANCDEAIGSPMEIVFDCTVNGVGIYNVTQNNLVTLELFDPEGEMVFAQEMSDFGRRFLGHIDDGPIARARVVGLPLAVAFFIVDDVTFGVTGDDVVLRLGDPAAGEVQLSWSGGAPPYTVERRSSCAAAWTPVATTSGTRLSVPTDNSPLVQYRVVETD